MAEIGVDRLAAPVFHLARKWFEMLGKVRFGATAHT
jgi:hypothetical protein